MKPWIHTSRRWMTWFRLPANSRKRAPLSLNGSGDLNRRPMGTLQACSSFRLRLEGHIDLSPWEGQSRDSLREKSLRGICAEHGHIKDVSQEELGLQAGVSKKPKTPRQGTGSFSSPRAHAGRRTSRPPAPSVVRASGSMRRPPTPSRSRTPFKASVASGS